MTPKATLGHLKLANWHVESIWASYSVGCWPMSRLWVSWGSPGTEHPSWRVCTSTLSGGAQWPAAAVPVGTGLDRPCLAAPLSKREMFLGCSQQHIPAIFLTSLNSSSLKFYASRSLLFTFSPEVFCLNRIWLLIFGAEHTKMYSKRLRLRNKLVLLAFFNC